MASNITGIVVVDRRCYKKQSNFLNRYSKSVCCDGSNHNRSQKNQLKPCRKGHMFRILPFSSANYYRCINKTPYPFYCKGEYIISCHSTNICNREDEMCSRKECCSNVSSCHTEDQKDEGCGAQIRPRRIYHPNHGMAEACKYICNDAKFVNERARNDIISLSRGLTRLNIRARRDVAFLGIGFLKLDVRAREDTEKIDTHMRKKTARLRHIATIIKDKAQSNLKNAADLHWSDGALEADLKRADFVARRRAMEDAFMALKFVKNFHDMLATKVYQKPQKESAFSINNMMGIITFEKNGETFNPFSGEEAYRNMASALSEADSIDYNDPEELELLVATLIDLDAMDSKRSLSLLAECSRSPDVSTRKALANALASAPSMWILGNAGMGALQRLADDHNPDVAAAASKAINELKQQWNLEEGDGLRFIMNQHQLADDTEDDDDDVLGDK